VAVGLFVRAGSVNEDAKNNGISHLIEHMFFKGTNKRNAFQIADDIDYMGAQINAMTSKTATCYYTVSADNHAGACIEVLSDIFFNSVFDLEELRKEKSVIEEEINMCEDTPEDVANELMFTAYFGKHPLSRPILGTKKTLKAITTDDIREYIGRRYTPKSTVISIVGNISLEQADGLVRKYFAGIFPERDFFCTKIAVHTPKGVSLYKKKGIEQANISIALPAFRFRDGREMAATVLNNIFGGGMSSRLFQRIREQMGLAYSVYSYLSSYSTGGIMSIYIGTAPCQAADAVAATGEEIRRLLSEGVNEREFVSGKEQLKGALILGQESTVAMMRMAGKYLLNNDEEFDIDAMIGEVDSVTRDGIMEAVEYIFRTDLACSAYVGKDETVIKL